MKIVVAGPFQCGKSTFVKKLDDSALNISTIDKKGKVCTIAMDIATINMDNNVKISLFGTPGLLRFDTIRNVVIEGADGIIFIFDGANPDMDDSAIQLLNEIRLVLPRDTPIVYLINKIDDTNCRAVEVVREQNYISKGAKIFGISALTGENIEESISEIIEQVRSSYSPLIKTLRLHTDNPLGLVKKLAKANVEEVIELLHAMELRGIISINRKEMTYQMNKLSEFYEV